MNECNGKETEQAALQRIAKEYILLEAETVKYREVLTAAKWALMQPLDGWKGEHEAKAIKLINEVLK